ncbi:MAG: DNA recombination protein RmuC [Thermodesulfobacteriota bacterium]|nr:DNA recombination protein RmuC [Thermodesulfobacteriota bacterium]
MDISGALATLIGSVMTGIVVWLAMRARGTAREERLGFLAGELEATRQKREMLEQTVASLSADKARLETTLAQEQEKIHSMNDFAQATLDSLQTAFKGLSADALSKNNENFLMLARSEFEKHRASALSDLTERQQAVEALVKPVKEAVENVNRQVNEVEKSRKQAYGSLSQQVASLIKTQEKLQSETGNLVQALRKPTVRGRWGEIQLRRVVEYAGMMPRCDFIEQPTVARDDNRLRPDLVVNLPGEKHIVVDAKAPLEAYLSALSAEDEATKKQFMTDHARQLRRHISQLSAKAYWEQFDNTPEFVVMFLPGEPFFIAAMEHDENIVPFGVENRVILATPTTLIALLQAISYGWHQEKLAENAQRIRDLGADLYARLSTMASHFQTVGKSLDKAVKSYNSAVGSLESRVLPAARKFPELGAGTGEGLGNVESVNTISRDIKAEELQDSPEEKE